MKLFKVSYIDDGDDGSYLTVGNSKEEVEEREKDKLCDKLSCCMGCWVFEVNEVDGHKIFVDYMCVVYGKERCDWTTK